MSSRVQHLFETSVNTNFSIPKATFFNQISIIRGGATFFERIKDKEDRNRSILFQTSLRIFREPQNHLKLSDLGKSLDPTGYIHRLPSVRADKVWRV
jgi:hypothetical protein